MMIHNYIGIDDYSFIIYKKCKGIKQYVSYIWAAKKW